MTASQTNRISLRLRDINQLFNSLDPSPFLDRDLDRDAEEFIVSWARESNRNLPFELVIHLGTVPDERSAEEAQNAVRHYFAARAEMKQNELHQLLKRAHFVLAIALLFLTTCLSVAGIAGRVFTESVADVVRESMMIVGWVAMWRPLEIYLYDWWPFRRQWRILQRLSAARVSLVPAPIKPASDPNAGSHPA